MSPDTCRTARNSLGWSPWTLARAAGLVERTIIDFEGGVTMPRPGTLIAIRRAFREAGVPMEAAE